MYRAESFANVPRGKRASALALKLPVWSPFQRTGHHCVWSGNYAMVWFWDQDQIDVGGGVSDPALAAMDAERAARIRILPETVFLPRKQDGAYLQACHHGVECQNWRHGVLLDSFWHAEQPAKREIDLFRERSGIKAETWQPTAAPSQFAPDPWTSAATPQEWLAANERALAVGCLLALSLALLWQEARFWKVSYLEETTARQFARVQEEAEPLIAARNEWLRLRRRNEGLAELLDQPSQAQLMALVDGALPDSTARFREWHYQQGQLSLIVEDPQRDPVAYIRALDAEPWFDQVTAKPGRGQDRLDIALRVKS